MKNGMYRCNYCHYDTKLAHEVVGHMQAFHEVRPRLERAPALHSCPQCPFEDMMKGKLTRHKVGCDKRFRPERNQEPPHDWDPPGKDLYAYINFLISRKKYFKMLLFLFCPWHDDISLIFTRGKRKSKIQFQLYFCLQLRFQNLHNLIELVFQF